mgnify:CR=1 FL=1
MNSSHRAGRRRTTCPSSDGLSRLATAATLHDRASLRDKQQPCRSGASEGEFKRSVRPPPWPSPREKAGGGRSKRGPKRCTVIWLLQASAPLPSVEEFRQCPNDLRVPWLW